MITFQLQERKSLAKEIRRIVAEQVENIVQLLSQPIEQPDLAIHEARKSIKRIRAVLELVREDLPDKVYHLENGFYRDLARSLAGARESFVALEKLDYLLDNYKDELGSKRQYTKVKNYLKKAHAAESEAVLGQTELFEEIIAKLAQATKRIKGWKFKHKGFKIVDKNLRRVYGLGQKRMRLAYQLSYDAENFHEWRKRVKHLWYHMQILSPVWDDMMQIYVQQLDELGDVLGDEHDFSELKRILLDMPDDLCESEQIQKLLDVIDDVRKNLRSQALMVAQRIYVDKPKAFSKRHYVYYKGWRQRSKKEKSKESVKA